MCTDIAAVCGGLLAASVRGFTCRGKPNFSLQSPLDDDFAQNFVI